MSRRRALAAGAILAALLLPSAVAACGAFYADQVEVDPDQEIVVAHRSGVETYVFRPRFCGAAKDFGVILPIPSAWADKPAEAPAALFDEVARYTEPTVAEVCDSGGIGCFAGSALGDAPPPPGFGTGVDVIDQGQVGMFQVSLLQATSVAAFTDWLTVKGYPYDASGEAAYAHYVTAGWYFVAIEVAAGASAPPPGMRLCGDLGPIQVSFASASPVIPARITSVNSVGAPPPRWRIAVLSAAEQRLATGSDFRADRYFSGRLSQAALGDYPALKAASRDGERLTVLDVTFPGTGASADVVLSDSPAPSDFRSTRHVVKDCGACSAGGAPMGFAAAAAGLALLRALRRGRGAARRA
ncbi:MAG TPA: DUF2330 domain-containing protein [Anaeromyxobacteraceae bacterium]|nr:DUF2330 domain-containing protein [Anaeromyxobacteraceae bacterium]